MKKAKIFKMTLASIGFVASFSASSGTITGGELLTIAGANTLAGWLGYSDLNFTNISNLDTGATAQQWHTDVSGHTNVISIYDVTYDDARYLIGGYSAIGHDGTGWQASPTNFIFNLTSGIFAPARQDTIYEAYQQFDHTSFFATFGLRYELFGGAGSIGEIKGQAQSLFGPWGDGSFGINYNTGFETNIFGTTRMGDIPFTVNGLESYVYSEPLATPLPGTAPLMLSALGALAAMARRKKKGGETVSKATT